MINKSLFNQICYYNAIKKFHNQIYLYQFFFLIEEKNYFESLYIKI